MGLLLPWTQSYAARRRHCLCADNEANHRLHRPNQCDGRAGGQRSDSQRSSSCPHGRKRVRPGRFNYLKGEKRVMAKPIISVFGSSMPGTESDAYQEARRLGVLLGEAGFIVATAAMAEQWPPSARGASEAGTRVIGVTSSHMEKWRPMPRMSGWGRNTPRLPARSAAPSRDEQRWG